MPLTQRRETKEKYPYFVFASLIEQLTPVERGRLYETPLAAYLEEMGLGTVTGGGCSLSDRKQPGEKDIAYAGLDIELANLDEALTLTKTKLNELGAPVGSTVQYKTPEGPLRSEPVGEMELLSVFIDNISLAPEIYQNADLETLCEGLRSALRADSIGELRGPCVWPSEVLLYFVGPNASRIFETLEPLRKDFPILQNARVVFQCRNSDQAPKELRITFNDE